MKQSKLFAPTTKEIPKDAEVVSHQLMLRAGFIRQVAGGMYAYLPLADRILNKIQTIIREEMAKIDANEMLMPTVIPAELWQESGRYNTYGPLLYKLNDRKNREFLLAPTHEETFTKVISDDIKSYKKLPITVFQLQTKYRDELRPRNGLLRGREFIMKDAYSFSADQAGLDQAFDAMDKAYHEIFDRVSLNYRVIEADAGDMGGKVSKEFSAIAQAGEDIIAYSDTGDYAANLETAADGLKPIVSDQEVLELEKIETPAVKTIKALAGFLNLPESQLVKTLIYKADNRLIAILLRGDFELNEVKLKNDLQINQLTPADPNEVFETIGAHFGSLGPVNLPSEIKIYVDQLIAEDKNLIVGANADGFHLKNVNFNRDFPVEKINDYRLARQDDLSPDGGKLQFTKGIEIGHIFKLGTFYSDSLNAKIQNSDGQLTSLIMGSYGIGVSRLLSAIAEQNHDENGFIWPKSVAPYDVHLIVVNYGDDQQRLLAEKIEQELVDNHFEVLIDDRDERPGIKFAEADLIGIPYRIVIGKKAAESIVEFKERQQADAQEINISDILGKLL